MKRILLTIILITASCPLISYGEDAHTDINDLRLWQNKPVVTKITSWNAFSRQFIDPPVFKLLVIPGVHTYAAEVHQANSTLKVESLTPVVSLAEIWPKMPKLRYTKKKLMAQDALLDTVWIYVCVFNPSINCFLVKPPLPSDFLTGESPFYRKNVDG